MAPHIKPYTEIPMDLIQEDLKLGQTFSTMENARAAIDMHSAQNLWAYTAKKCNSDVRLWQ